MKILVVEDDELMQQTLQAVFSDCESVIVNNADAAENALKEHIFTAAFLDIQIKGDRARDGLYLLQKIQEMDHYLPCIMISGLDDPETVSRSLELGAIDYVAKGTVNPQAYRIALLKAQNWRKLVSENPSSREALKNHRLDDYGIKGKSNATTALRTQISSLADMPGPFLILGETGTGKELVARALWSAMGKAHRPFIAVNCASLPENLVESELFGYERGAFTGALTTKTGLFEAANGGDIFLDEIGDLGLDLQAKLLRVLQEKRVRRLGSDKERPVDFRVIAATNIDLAEAVRRKEFREDMFYRLNVYPIRVPVLRDRKEDIGILLTYFLQSMNRGDFKVSSEAENRLQTYNWPGNVRQLRALALSVLPFLKSPHKVVTLEMVDRWLENQNLGLQGVIGEGENGSGGRSDGGIDPLAQIKDAIKNQKSVNVVALIDSLQKQFVEAALAETKNNRSQAAKILGISRQRLSNWLSEWGIF